MVGQRDAATGNKSVIFHLVPKQRAVLRRAIAYYGLLPACDISKQSRTVLSERLAGTNEECVLTSRRGLLGVWTSSSRGNPADNVLVMVEPGNGLGPHTYRAVLRGTNFGHEYYRGYGGYVTVLLLLQTQFLRGVEVGGQDSRMPCLLLCKTGRRTCTTPA